MDEQTESTETTEAKTYTQQELDDAIQRESDRRVSEALKKQERKNQGKIKEAEKLAKMNADERYQYDLDQREKAIQEKEEQLAVAENKATAAQILSQRGISADLVSLVVAKDADTMQDNINLLDKAFKDSVKAEVEKRLATTTPKKNLPTDTEITKDTFRKMTFTQQAELYQQNPTLYKQLSGRG